MTVSQTGDWIAGDGSEDVGVTSTRLDDVRLAGRCPAPRNLDTEIETAARSDANVLVTADPGIDIEVVARLIHDRSARSATNLVTLNCAVLTDTLLESELFGHTRGSFPGAYRDKPGLLEMTGRCTLFLEEIGAMSPRLQAVLFRFLESGETHRIGAGRAQGRVDVRVIAACSHDLAPAVATGVFREDLYRRLSALHIRIPARRVASERHRAVHHHPN